LAGVRIEISHGFFYDFLTLFLKVSDWPIFGISLEFLNINFNCLKGFSFDFVTSILSDHFSLIW
jgi:hypothetical protein